MIEVELWDRDGIPIKYHCIAVPVQEICLPRSEKYFSYAPEDIPMAQSPPNRRFRYRGKSADLSEYGATVRLIYQEI